MTVNGASTKSDISGTSSVYYGTEFGTKILNLNFNHICYLDFPCGSLGKESAYSAGDLGLIPGLGRFPLQYSGLQKSIDCVAHGVAKSPTQVSKFHFTY